MRKLFSAVAVGVLALGFSACSQDTLGPDLGPQFGRGPGSIQKDTAAVNETTDSNISECGWTALRKADGQLSGKGCK